MAGLLNSSLDGIFKTGFRLMRFPLYRHPGKICFIFLIAILASCSALIPIQVPSNENVSNETDWLTLGRNNQHTHYSNVNIGPPLEIIWKTRVKSVVTDHPLAIGDNILATTASGQLYEVRYETGKVVGSGTIGPAIDHVPTIHDGILYTGFSLGDNTIIGLSLTSTKNEISRKYSDINTTPIYWEKKLYFGTNRGMLLCINAQSGDRIWDFKAKAPIQSSAAMIGQYVIFGDDQGEIYALDATSGLKLWEKELQGSIFSHPVIDDSLVFIGTLDGYLYALEYHNGKRKWQQKFSGAFYGSPSVYNNVIYIGNNNHTVTALRKTNGEILWTFATDGIVNTVPLPSPDYLYVSSWDENLYVLNRLSGKLLFKMDLDRPLKSSPIIYRDVLLVQTANGHLFALANGKYAESRKGKK